MVFPPDHHTPFVSVALATYNGALYLGEQLRSVLGQGHSNLEFIIVDDASEDNTRSLLEEWAAKDSRIKLFFNEKNLGYRQTFYSALLHCRGEYILFCDQDDVWFSHKIEKLLEAAEDNLLVFSDSELIKEDGKRMTIKLSDTVTMLQPGGAKVNRGFVIGNCVWGHTILFHRSLLDWASLAQNNHPHDWWLAVVSSQLNRIRYCPLVLNYYRQHEKNVTHAVPRKKSGIAKYPGRKQEEYQTQLSRIASILELPFNPDKAFYENWHRLYLRRTEGFSFSLFRFLIRNRKEIFSLKKKNFISQVIAIRKMCRKIP